MTYRYCPECREWFEGKLRACPECGWERPAFNKHLRTAELNDNLYRQIEHARAS